ncbi:NAD(P)-dependent alcohol dehydrogenase [Maribellus sediminis]|uniref:NAD(P)-dependent alcohol dehydrogenase n=1 Tax=Maribellus sediminis TaxID=2696285 RepID=UPI00142FDF24|nr:NAD(P)-dependent alcohol dehydrogenase [Maribellus sediminis]
MKAVVCEKYGTPEVLHVVEADKPAPKDNEVLVKVMATTANAADARIRGAVFPSIFNFPVKLAMGFKGPRKKVLGVELSGVIEAVGKNVRHYQVGDEIFASSGASFGAYAEYCCLPENAVMATKPKNMSFEEAAAVPHCALAALHYLKKGNVDTGQKVMVYGASGGIGTYAVQIAKAFGAKVTGVCSTANVEQVKALGADEVIDYTREALSKENTTYDVIFDTIGKAPITTCVNLLEEGGMYLSAVHLELSRILEGIKLSVTSSKKVIGGVAPYTSENLNFLKSLIEEGKLKAAIDKTFPLEQIREAHAYVDTGHKKGHVVLKVNRNK